MTINEIKLRNEDKNIQDTWKKLAAAYNWAAEIARKTDWSKETVERLARAREYMSGVLDLMNREARKRPEREYVEKVRTAREKLQRWYERKVLIVGSNEGPTGKGKAPTLVKNQSRGRGLDGKLAPLEGGHDHACDLSHTPPHEHQSNTSGSAVGKDLDDGTDRNLGGDSSNDTGKISTGHNSSSGSTLQEPSFLKWLRTIDSNYLL